MNIRTRGRIILNSTLSVLAAAALSLVLLPGNTAVAQDSTTGKTPQRVVQEKPEPGETLRQRHIYDDGSEMLLVCSQNGQIEYRVFDRWSHPVSKKVLFPLGKIKLEESYGGWMGERLESVHERRHDGTTVLQGKRLSTGTFELREFGADGKTVKRMTRQFSDGNEEVSVFRKDGSTVESWLRQPTSRDTARGYDSEEKRYTRDGKLQVHTQSKAGGARTVSVYNAGKLSHRLFYGAHDATLKAQPLLKLEEFDGSEALQRQIEFEYLNNQGSPRVVQACDFTGGKKTAVRWYHISGGLLVEETFDAAGKTTDLQTHNPPKNSQESLDSKKLVEPTLDSDWAK